ncbi:hypothetical protein [Chroococcidiopsis sp. CCNUC1]|uniref:hypothetical protein n=1 Tax=Chroococcidiopsis sp. CCNUC1 TaxID=2653189 RepID=UPI0020208374|nr:hypothetical protein [Chroococcidiopsis sp. CCNUC1]URD52068.1 hypothetical protein M5J74_08740 [Chroococcidiopsis sp. CCNUC1]
MAAEIGDSVVSVQTLHVTSVRSYQLSGFIGTSILQLSVRSPRILWLQPFRTAEQCAIADMKRKTRG